jgi:hypothetical protein
MEVISVIVEAVCSQHFVVHLADEMEKQMKYTLTRSGTRTGRERAVAVERDRSCLQQGAR